MPSTTPSTRWPAWARQSLLSRTPGMVYLMIITMLILFLFQFLLLPVVVSFCLKDWYCSQNYKVKVNLARLPPQKFPPGFKFNGVQVMFEDDRKGCWSTWFYKAIQSTGVGINKRRQTRFWTKKTIKKIRKFFFFFFVSFLDESLFSFFFLRFLLSCFLL